MYRAVDPDPDESAVIFSLRSGSRRGKFEEKKRKNARKLVPVEIVILL